jgi:hypothetical protein
VTRVLRQTLEVHAEADGDEELAPLIAHAVLNLSIGPQYAGRRVTLAGNEPGTAVTVRLAAHAQTFDGVADEPAGLTLQRGTIAPSLQVIVLLVVLLGLSLLANYLQFRSAITGELKAENATLTKTLGTIDRLANAQLADDAQLLGRLQLVADSASGAVSAYRRIATQIPLDANCAPKQARVDKVNAILSRPSESPPE